MHRDPAGQARLAGIGPGPAGLDDPDHPVAMRSGETLHVPEVTPQFLRSLSPAESERVNLEALAPRAVLAVPLSVRGRVTGALVFTRTIGSPPFAPAEVELAEELARRWPWRTRGCVTRRSARAVPEPSSWAPSRTSSAPRS